MAFDLCVQDARENGHLFRDNERMREVTKVLLFGDVKEGRIDVNDNDSLVAGVMNIVRPDYRRTDLFANEIQLATHKLIELVKPKLDDKG